MIGQEISHNFIICGASRSGKSSLSQRLRDKFNISWLVGDAMVSSMEDAFPDIGISHHGDLHAIGNKFGDYIKYLLWNYNYEGSGYVFDSTHLYPRNVIKIKEKIGEVPAVFLGYANADPQQKLEEIRQHDPSENWWTSDLSDKALFDLINKHIRKSQELQTECKTYNLPYVEVSYNFHAALDEAEQLLIKRL